MATDHDDAVPSGGPAMKGSQHQLQVYVNRLPDVLDAAILEAAPALRERAPSIRWVSPLEADAYLEYRDRAFLKQIGAGGLTEALRAFWPRRGPVWDGLATLDFPDGARGALLIEAKAHAAELRSSGSAAGPESRARILSTLDQIRRRLGSTVDSAVWLGPHYQLANRIAHTVFLRDAGIDAWLVLVSFHDDVTWRPTPREELASANTEAFAALGVSAESLPFVVQVYVPGIGVA